MRIAALYDIHGNLPALDAVLAELPEVDAIVIGGDVLPGPLARETLDRIASLDNVHYVMGNGDRAAIERVRADIRRDVPFVTRLYLTPVSIVNVTRR